MSTVPGVLYRADRFQRDHDHQVTTSSVSSSDPSGSACSIAIGTGLTQMKPGSIEGLMMVVADVQAARDELCNAART